MAHRFGAVKCQRTVIVYIYTPFVPHIFSIRHTDADVNRTIVSVEVEAVEGHMLHQPLDQRSGIDPINEKVCGLPEAWADQVAAGVELVTCVLVQIRGDAAHGPANLVLQATAGVATDSGSPASRRIR